MSDKPPAMYEPSIPIRFEIRKREVWQGEERGGSPVYGGRSIKVTEHYRVLQYLDDSLVWVDVPEVHEP